MVYDILETEICFLGGGMIYLNRKKGVFFWEKN
jgi:hypothetical protein